MDRQAKQKTDKICHFLKKIRGVGGEGGLIGGIRTTIRLFEALSSNK